jgi:serine/threonine protein phosphatase 1
MNHDDRFADDLRNSLHEIDPDDWADVWVVGDVHGCRRELERLVDRIDDGDTLFVIVGDLVRKGPDSAGVVSFVRDRDNVKSVRGNNEAKVIRGEKTLPDLSGADVEYLASLPIGITLGDSLVVHGGIDPQRPLAEHSAEDLLTTRSLTPDDSYQRPYWFERYAGPRRVFFGHTVLESPVETDHAIGLDTGCVYGGELTAYHFETGETVTVEATETYQERSDEKVVRPQPQGVR